MPDLHVTLHAIERFQERVARVGREQAKQALTSPAIILAAEFGAHYVRLGTGQHVVIIGHRVVTVLPKDTMLGVFDPKRTYK